MSDVLSLLSHLISLVDWSPLHLLIVAVAIQRIVELRIARRNERRARERGAIEVGRDHYAAIVTLHLLWFIGMLVEIVLLTRSINALWYLLLPAFIAAQALRIWSMRSLGEAWNTRILVVPGSRVVRRGPYKYLRHPNYLAVIIELAVVPVMLGAYLTAITTSLINTMLLRNRIRAEVEALRQFAKGFDATPPQRGSAAKRRRR